MPSTRPNIPRDPLAGKYCEKRHFRREFIVAGERLKELGGRVIPGTHDYEAFIYEGNGVRLVFYPHRTTAGNRHIRIRATGKPDPKALRAAIFALAENSCTFQFPSDGKLHQEAVHHALKINRGYADSPRSQA